jgi:hypothetical protein
MIPLGLDLDSSEPECGSGFDAFGSVFGVSGSETFEHFDTRPLDLHYTLGNIMDVH